MNNKGFIATSLIYSFFLIFITLFLTIIADYLQNKVLLNTIEKGIKDDINSTMGIQDFEVGSFIGLSTEKDNCVNFDLYVISRINYGEGDDNFLILYSLSNKEPDDSTADKITLKDLDTGYMNATYYNKILYSFKNEKGEFIPYKIDYEEANGTTGQLCINSRETNGDGTLKDVDVKDDDFLNQFVTTEGYVYKNNNSSNVCDGAGYRKRIKLETTNDKYFINNRASKCGNIADAAGFIYLKKVKD